MRVSPPDLRDFVAFIAVAQLSACAGGFFAGLPFGPDDPVEDTGIEPWGPIGCIGPESDPRRSGCTETVRSVGSGLWYVDDYDHCGRRIRRVDYSSPNQRETTYLYDPEGRLLRTQSPWRQHRDRYFYGPAGQLETLEHEASGKVWGVEAWTYGGPDGLLPLSWTVNALSLDRPTEAYAYDADGHLEQVWAWSQFTGDLMRIETVQTDAEGRRIEVNTRGIARSDRTTLEWDGDLLVRTTRVDAQDGWVWVTLCSYDELGRPTGEDDFSGRYAGPGVRRQWDCPVPSP